MVSVLWLNHNLKYDSNIQIINVLKEEGESLRIHVEFTEIHLNFNTTQGSSIYYYDNCWQFVLLFASFSHVCTVNFHGICIEHL